jgi:hypothetical protein
MPRIISMAIRKIMNDPAMANDDTSIPKIPSRGLPMKRNAKSIRKETRVTFADLMLPDLAFISIIIGIDPGMSIMAKSTIKAARISIMFRFMFC